MGQYLTKFNGLIGKRQTEQIIKLLNKKRNQGQIKSLDEFTNQLKLLVQELTSTVLTPSLRLFLGKENDFISSEQYNFMLDRIEDDLQAGFEEVNKIDEIQKSHEVLIKDILFKNLLASVNELESKISLYEFLNRNTYGFDSAIFSTFREAKSDRTSRNTDQFLELFRDPRTAEILDLEEDATVELVGERLVLPLDTEYKHTAYSVRQIFDSTSPQSELIVQPGNIFLANIIDNTIGTYWSQSLLYSTRKENVKIQLEFNFGIVQEISFIEIKPACKTPIVLEAIHYLNSSNTITELEIEEIKITSLIKFPIRKISTNKVILTFRSDESIVTNFEYDPNQETLFNQAKKEPRGGYKPTIHSAANDLDSLIVSEKVKESIGLTLSTTQSFSGYEYNFGFDNINFGTATYYSKGALITSPLEISPTGLLGLRTVESRPYKSVDTSLVNSTDETYDNNDNNEITITTGRIFLGSIEYWAIKQDFTNDGLLIRSTTFPILPLGVLRIHQERLLLTSKSSEDNLYNDLGQTIFFTNRDEDEGDILVYRNGILLDDVTDDPTATDGWKYYVTSINATPNTGSSMKFDIQILDPSPSDIYTVTYNPLVSSTTVIPGVLSEYANRDGLKVVDLVGDLSARLCTANLTVLDKSDKESQISYSKVYLSIILRQNTADISLTPTVEEYILLGGQQDSKKFEE